MFKIIALLLLLTSCTTTLKYQMDNHSFLTPETKGEFLKGDVGFSYHQTQKVVLAKAFDDFIFGTTTVSDSKSISQGASLLGPLSINLGLINAVDFYVQGARFGFKYQFLGASQKENSTGYKGAIALGYGYDKRDKEDVTYVGISTTRIYSTELKLTNTQVSMLGGYRFTPQFMIYLNLFRDDYKYSGALTSNQFSSINVEGKSYNQGALLGLQWTHGGSKHQFVNKLEVGIADAKVDNKDDLTAGTMGTNLSWTW